MDALDAEEAADQGFEVNGEGWRREDGFGQDLDAAYAEGGEGRGVPGEFDGEIDGREVGRSRGERRWRRS